eukprot:3782518-Pyramimonas_sp.AAC.1
MADEAGHDRRLSASSPPSARSSRKAQCLAVLLVVLCHLELRVLAVLGLLLRVQLACRGLGVLLWGQSRSHGQLVVGGERGLEIVPVVKLGLAGVRGGIANGRMSRTPRRG